MDKIVEEAINELIRLGLVEVVGIKQNGEWLYGATPRGKSFVHDGSSMLAVLEEIKKLDKDGNCDQ